MIDVKCSACGNELEELGALVFSPPDIIHLSAIVVTKYHLCADCFWNHSVVFSANHFTVEHSFECRLGGNMAECEYHFAVERIYEPGVDRGRWMITGLDDDDLPILINSERSHGQAEQ